MTGIKTIIAKAKLAILSIFIIFPLIQSMATHRRIPDIEPKETKTKLNVPRATTTKVEARFTFFTEYLHKLKRLFATKMKLIRIFLVALVALTMFAWVAQEDGHETDETFSRCEMLQGQQLPPNQLTASVIEISSVTRRDKNKNLASAVVSTPRPTMLSLASCILRC
jgi:hypothetical protein